MPVPENWTGGRYGYLQGFRFQRKKLNRFVGRIFSIIGVEGRRGGAWRHPAEQERKMMKKLGFGIINCTHYAKIHESPKKMVFT